MPLHGRPEPRAAVPGSEDDKPSRPPPEVASPNPHPGGVGLHLPRRRPHPGDDVAMYICMYVYIYIYIYIYLEVWGL